MTADPAAREGIIMQLSPQCWARHSSVIMLRHPLDVTAS
jgi:hypothetical protein